MHKRNAFTLVELVVVIMILGILATIAVPKFLNTSSQATDNGVRQTLSVIRDAIEMYAAQNSGSLPGQGDDLPTDLAGYLRGDFPASPVGAANATVSYATGATTTADATPTTGWKFNKDSGEFICNSPDALASDNSVTYESL